MTKKYWLLLLLGIIFAIFQTEKKVYLIGKPIPVLKTFEGEDWKKRKSFGFITSLDGKEEKFQLYPAVFEALIYDSVVEINLAEIDDQFYGRNDIEFEHLGITKEGIHLFNIFDHSKWISHLLFVEFETNQGAILHDLYNDKKKTFYEDQLLIRKIGEILLGYGDYTNKFILEEDTLKFEDYTFNLSLKPPSPQELVKNEFPFYFDKRPFISPVLLATFISSPRSGYSSIVARDLIEVHNDPTYCFFGSGFTNSTEDYEYHYEGKTKNNVHIVKCVEFLPHPIVSRHQFFLYVKDYQLSLNWETKTITRDKARILLKKIGELDLYYSQFLITDNTISYTDTEWENKPYKITGEVKYTDMLQQIDLKTFSP